jgi:hypothetical protein
MISKEVLNRIKMVVFDLDGTLLTDEGDFFKDTISLINKLESKGVIFSIATGRLHSAVLKYSEILKLEAPIISLDGTLIKTPNDGKIIYKAQLPVKYVKKAIDLADKYFLKIALCHGDAIYYTEENSLIPELLEKLGAVYSLVNSYYDVLNDTLEVVITGEYSETVKYVSNKLSFPYTFGIRNSFYKSHSHGGLFYLELRKMGSSKGDGLKKLCKFLKINIKEAAVIGDWYNDKSLFETDALKIAVANAIPELKRVSDMITKKTNNNGGINEFFYLLLKAKS